MPRHFFILMALSSSGFSQEKTTYDDHVFPIFQQACLNCHNPDKAKGGLDLSSFSAAIKGGSGGKIVEPGDVGCALVAAVQQTGEKKMPPEGDKLSSDLIGVLKSWIEDGLLENKSSTARKPSKPKFETTLRSDPAAKPDGPPPMPEHLLLEPPVVTGRPASVQAIAASPWASLLAITGQHQILLHNTDSLELVGILPFPDGEPVSLSFTPDGRYLIVGGGTPGKSGATITFDIRSGEQLLKSGKEFDSILAADIRPGFDIVATGGPSRLLKIWNTETGALVRSIKKHTDWITALDLSGDGVLLASGDRNGGVWVWESDTGSEFQTLRGHQAAITATSFRADSNLLATSSEDGTVRFWEMNGGSEVKKIDAHPGGVTAFAFARNGSSVTAGRDMKAKFWKSDFTPARDLAQNLPALPTAVALDSEGTRAFIADAQGTVRVFQTADSKAVGEIQANPPAIETRLQKLAGEAASQQQLLANADQAIADKVIARDTARQALAEAEKTYRQTVELHQAAKAGAEQSPNEGAAKIAADALARIQPAEQAIPPQKQALEAAEKAVTEATATRDSAKTSLANLKSAAKRWSAAAINTRALTARHQADETLLALEDSHLNFPKTTTALTLQATALNTRRSDREQLGKYLKAKDLSTETVIELEATLAAIDIKINRELESLRHAESDILDQREAIEQTAPLAHKAAAESISLRDAYFKSLE